MNHVATGSSSLLLVSVLTLSGCFFQENLSPPPTSFEADDLGAMPDLGAMEVDMHDMIVVAMPDLAPGEEMGGDMSCTSFQLEDGGMCVASSCQPVQESCELRSSACERFTLVQDDASCTLACEASPITGCESGDGCCPMGCDVASDEDCEAMGPILFYDLCQMPVRASQLFSRTFVVDAMELEERCCEDLNGDGVTDNAWAQFMYNGPGTYNARIAQALSNQALHMLWAFEGVDAMDGAPEMASAISLWRGSPRCGADLNEELLVYDVEAAPDKYRLDSFTWAVSRDQVQGQGSELFFPLFGLDGDEIFYIPLRDARMSATFDEVSGQITNGALSGHVSGLDYFRALDDYMAEKCACFGERMFRFTGPSREDLEGCNDLGMNSCEEGSSCKEYVNYCPFVIDRFSGFADVYSSEPEQPCSPEVAGSPMMCDAISLGLRFSARSAYLVK